MPQWMRKFLQDLFEPALLTCPTCGSANLRRQPGLALYADHYECEQGHRFSHTIEGP